MEQRVLGGRYLLKDKVGTGGMATVFRAQDQVLDRTVAVKIMLPQYAGDATFAARFKQEAQAAAGLSSPYIVGVYDWGKDGDTYYIVMEYLRGTDLKSGIKSHGALDPKKVAQIGSQISSALSVAHKHEIIHRDIKPQNIMVLPDGNIKVMDFGIARKEQPPHAGQQCTGHRPLRKPRANARPGPRSHLGYLLPGRRDVRVRHRSRPL